MDYNEVYMLDIQFIRDNRAEVEASIKNRKLSVDIDQLLEFDDQRRKLHAEVEQLRAERNKLSANKSAKPTDTDIKAASKVKTELADIEPKLADIEVKFDEILAQVPNIHHPDVPIGPDESGNKPIRSWGDIPKFDFEPKDHVDIAEGLGILDIPRAAKVSGARFNYLKGDLALLQLALLQYAVEQVTDENVIAKLIEDNNLQIPAKAFTMVIPPVLVRPETMARMARLEPKDDRFITLNEEYVLVGSAEHSMGSMFMDEVLDSQELPIRLAGYSPAFRREAGSYGKDTRGILRQHQFDKLELETFSTSETGEDEHKLMIAIQEYLMQQLKLPYQVVSICTGDMGAPDYMQTDIETWMPGQDKYRETHTADYMRDYQARRLKTRYKDEAGKTQFAHMNDATAVAIGRTLIAILENYQTKDGKVNIPEVLQKYINKKEIS